MLTNDPVVSSTTAIMFRSGIAIKSSGGSHPKSRSAGPSIGQRKELTTEPNSVTSYIQDVRLLEIYKLKGTPLIPHAPGPPGAGKLESIEPVTILKR